MYGDFSRDSFDYRKHYQRVLMQQGRPLTDSDWNEQMSLAREAQWEIVRSLLGEDQGTLDDGFRLEGSNNSLSVKHGSYWICGLHTTLHCDTPIPPDKLPESTTPIFLEAWEETISPAADPDLLEPSLNPSDTAWRTVVAWRLGIQGNNASECDCQVDPASPAPPLTPPAPSAAPPAPHETSAAAATTENAPSRVPKKHCDCRARQRSLYVCRTPSQTSAADPVCQPADSIGNWPGGEYLYRIEVHRGGRVLKLSDTSATIDQKDLDTAMTFKWSRENASSVIAIECPANTLLTIDDQRFSTCRDLATKDRLELRDQSGRSADKRRRLAEVVHVDDETFTIDVEFDPASATDPSPYLLTSHTHCASRSFHVQRWNHKGEVVSKEGETVNPRQFEKHGSFESKEHFTVLPKLAPDGAVYAVGHTDRDDLWIELEFGIQIRFDRCACYREGDYWLIRTSTTTPNGFSNLYGKCVKEPTAKPNSPPANTPRVFKLHRTGGHYWVELGTVSNNNGPGFQLNPGNWRGVKLAREVSALPTANAPSTTPPAAGPINPGASTAPAPPNNESPPHSSTLLTPDGFMALKAYFATPRDMTRHIPARYLDYKPNSEPYRRFRAPLLVSDVLEPTEERYLAKVERCVKFSDAERETVFGDARTDYRLASDFQKLFCAGGIRALMS